MEEAPQMTEPKW